MSDRYPGAKPKKKTSFDDSEVKPPTPSVSTRRTQSTGHPTTHRIRISTDVDVVHHDCSHGPKSDNSLSPSTEMRSKSTRNKKIQTNYSISPSDASSIGPFSGVYSSSSSRHYRIESGSPSKNLRLTNRDYYTSSSGSSLMRQLYAYPGSGSALLPVSKTVKSAAGARSKSMFSLGSRGYSESSPSKMEGKTSQSRGGDIWNSGSVLGGDFTDQTPPSNGTTVKTVQPECCPDHLPLKKSQSSDQLRIRQPTTQLSGRRRSHPLAKSHSEDVLRRKGVGNYLGMKKKLDVGGRVKPRKRSFGIPRSRSVDKEAFAVHHGIFNKIRSRTKSESDASSINPVAHFWAQRDMRRATIKGELKIKKKGQIKITSQRAAFFWLEGKTLFYCKNDAHPGEPKRISLAKASIQMKDGSETALTIETEGENGKKIYVLQATTKRLQEEWIGAIRMACKDNSMNQIEYSNIESIEEELGNKKNNKGKKADGVQAIVKDDDDEKA